MCKRGDSSGARSRGGGGATVAAATTSQQQQEPTQITYSQFQQMTPDEKYDFMDRVLSDSSITVPSYLDDSFTTKVMYSVGMTNKPRVVSDSALDGMAGKEIFRCVSDSSNPRMKAKDIIEQVRTGDYTRMSDSGGSVYGRALYFADQYGKSATFGKGLSSVVMRAKVDPKAKIVAESTLIKKMNKDAGFMKVRGHGHSEDHIALYAIANGFDGWRDSNYGYYMPVNRGVLSVSSTIKKAKNQTSGRSNISWGISPTA